MKKQLFAVGVVLVMFFAFSAMPAFAVDDMSAEDLEAQKFDQKVSDVLQKIDDRIAQLNDKITRLTDARTCVEAALVEADLKACRKKYMPEGTGKGTPPKR